MSPEIDPVIPGEFIFDTWGNPVARRTIQRYSDAAQLATLNPTPEIGDAAYLLDTHTMSLWDGSQWVDVAQQGKFQAMNQGQNLDNFTTGNTAYTVMGPEMFMGDTAVGVPANVTATVTSSVLAPAGNTSTYRLRIQISRNNGGSYSTGEAVYGTADGVARRQAISATHFTSDSPITGIIRVRAQVAWVAGGDAAFQTTTLIATVAKIGGLT